ncbi:Ig-like domain-containing protein, partial [Candidatus Falkowbacteria bacterium]|nr:Ig-like domain-containing protein [Candidatus Falkowbacteria bacterium]
MLLKKQGDNMGGEANGPRLGYKAVLAAFLGILIIGAGFAALNFFLRAKPADENGKAKFALSAQLGDLNGIDKASKFILSSNKQLTPDEIKNNIKFSPPFDYAVKEKRSLLSLLAGQVLASANQASFGNEYELTPTQALVDGVVYRAVTATSSDLQFDHDYSWAFNVKSGFGLKETLPANEATGVPVDTGIEITMNRLDISRDVARYFSIEPSAKGRFEVGLNKIVFIPEGALKDKTLYKVTIKKGYQAADKADILDEDKSFSFETSGADSASSLPSLSWSNDYFELSTAKEGYLEASGDATNSEAVISKYDSGPSFLKDFYTYRDRAYDWSNYNKAPFKPSESVKEVKKFNPVLLKRNESDNYGLIQLPSKLDQGFYIVRLAVGDKFEYTFLRVSPL